MASPPRAKGALALIGETLGTAASNLGPSALEQVKGLYQTVRHPLDTLKGALEIASGVTEHGKQLLPKAMQPMMAHVSTEKADAVGRYLVQRYGGLENIRQTFMHDPVGLAADVAGVLSGGELLAARAPGILGTVGRAAGVAAKFVDPVSLAMKTTGGVTKLAGRGLAHVPGVLTTKGAPVIEQAFQAGRQGGASSRALKKGLLGKTEPRDITDPLNRTFKTVGERELAEYNAGMGTIHNDPQIVPNTFDEIDAALNSAEELAYTKGHSGTAGPFVLDESAAKTHAKIKKLVDDWKALPANEFHTPGQLDQLKQAIGAVGEIGKNSADGLSSRADKIVGTVYDAVRQKILDTAPAYGDLMKAYEARQDAVTEFQHATGADKPTAAARANAANKVRRLMEPKNPSQRSVLQKLHASSGGNEAMSAIAGEALSPMFPPIKPALTEVGLAAAGGTLLHQPLLALAAPLASPRLMGSAAFRAGTALRYPLKAAELAGKFAESGYPRSAVILGRGQASPDVEALFQKYAAKPDAAADEAPVADAPAAAPEAPAAEVAPDFDKMSTPEIEAWIAQHEGAQASAPVADVPAAAPEAPAAEAPAAGAPAAGSAPDFDKMSTPEIEAWIARQKEDLAQRVEHRESRGKQSAVSPAGAKGVMQLMDNTARDPGFGVAPARDNSEAENRRVGRDYLEALRAHYNNTPTALMAYNWGPGTVNRWLKNPDPAKVPLETRRYVNALSGQTLFEGA
jgi:soluble lytic murein transglycosylase-like protein